MICPFIHYSSGASRECEAEYCAIWDDKNHCCSFKRIDPIVSTVNQIPSEEELYPFGTGTPYPPRHRGSTTAGAIDPLNKY